MIDGSRSLEGALKLLKRQFEHDVAPSIHRHKAAIRPGQRDRLKHFRAVVKQQERMRRMERKGGAKPC